MQLATLLNRRDIDMEEYTVRAVMEFGSSDQWSRDDEPPMVWPQVPVDMGPLRLDVSPNVDLYFAEMFGIDPEQTVHLTLDRNYPMSVFYLDTDLEMPDRQSPVALVDERFANFELLLRLFQPGDVSVRRHSFVNDNRLKVALWGHSIKPSVTTRYRRPAYPFSGVILSEFGEFFARYWDLLDSLDASVKLGLSRFNSSYERRDLEDRLIDLVIALEAPFNDDDPGSITYKIATRCAGWLHPPGEHRLSTFRFVKDAYRLRSDAVHARSKRRREPTKEELDRLESVVRACLLKFLDYQKLHGNTPTPAKLDEVMMEGLFGL